MDRDRLLGVVSAVQLTTGILGLAVALKRRHPYDVPLLHGRPDQVARDWVLDGTALSAPIVMLAAQWVAPVAASGCAVACGPRRSADSGDHGRGVLR